MQVVIDVIYIAVLFFFFFCFFNDFVFFFFFSFLFRLLSILVFSTAKPVTARRNQSNGK